jgi:hypothetical protein
VCDRCTWTSWNEVARRQGAVQRFVALGKVGFLIAEVTRCDRFNLERVDVLTTSSVGSKVATRMPARTKVDSSVADLKG